jgi:hypothetical protein
MKNLMKTVALAGVLLIAVACSSSKTATTSPTSAAPAAGASTSTTAKTSSSSGDTAAFCAKLAAEADQTTAFAASVGTPAQAAKLADLKAANADIAASAPDAIHDAVAKFYAISELADNALTSTNPAEKAAAVKAAADAAKDPAAKSAIADYTAWVQANCGDQTSKILSAGK